MVQRGSLKKLLHSYWPNSQSKHVGPVHLTSIKTPPAKGEFLFATAYHQQQEMEVPMLACMFVLLFFSPVIVLTTMLKNGLSPDELAKMGVRLENSHA